MKTTHTLDVEHRRSRLRQWIAERCSGKQAVFVNLTGINQGEPSALLKNKSFGEVKARNLENLAGMPSKWLDQDLPASDAPTIPSKVIKLPEIEDLAIVEVVALMRKMNDIGKGIIICEAKHAARNHPIAKANAA